MPTVRRWLLHKRPRPQWGVIVLLLPSGLALYAPGVERHTNLADRVDSLLLGHHAYKFDAASGQAHDPEGVLSTVGALVTTLLGVRAGAWLRRGLPPWGQRFGVHALAVYAGAWLMTCVIGASSSEQTNPARGPCDPEETTDPCATRRTAAPR